MANRHVIPRLEADLRDLTVSELRDALGARTSRRPKRVIRTRLFRAAILQAARANDQAAARDEPPAFAGHVRSLWHAIPEVVLSRLSDAERGKDPYDAFCEELSRMVFVLGAATYAQLHITDSNWEERRIGTAAPHIIVLAEKHAYFRLLRRVHERFGVTVCITSGFASGATSEYTARHVLDATDRPAALLALVDYDPWGWEIGRAFQTHLRHFGVPLTADWTPIFGKKDLPSGSRLATAALPIPRRGPGTARVIDRWMGLTRGGIGGQERRVELEALSTEELEPLVVRAVQAALDAPE